MDARYQVAGRDEYENTNEQGHYVQEDDQGNVYLHRSLADIVGLRVQFDKTRMHLQQNQADADDVAKE